MDNNTFETFGRLIGGLIDLIVRFSSNSRYAHRIRQNRKETDIMSKNHVTEEVVSPTGVISIIEIIGSILGGIASVIEIIKKDTTT